MIKADKKVIAKHVKEILKIATKNHVYLHICVDGEGHEPWADIDDVPRNQYKDTEYVRLSKSETQKSRQIKEKAPKK